jgi:hypothetical protein
VTITHGACGAHPATQDVQTGLTFNAWWASDKSCSPQESGARMCMRQVVRECPDMLIETMYEPAQDVLVRGVGTVTYADGCITDRTVEVRAEGDDADAGA